VWDTRGDGASVLVREKSTQEGRGLEGERLVDGGNSEEPCVTRERLLVHRTKEIRFVMWVRCTAKWA